jgi:predicted nucleic acid-binding protein
MTECSTARLSASSEFLNSFAGCHNLGLWVPPTRNALDRAEQNHRWVAECFEKLDAPLLVCEPVLAEAMYLLARYPRAQDALLDFIHIGALSVAFRIDEHIGALRKLLQKYRDTPMSLADACIVRMSELHDRHAVLTLDPISSHIGSMDAWR